jgi:hypothetical protein
MPQTTNNQPAFTNINPFWIESTTNSNNKASIIPPVLKIGSRGMIHIITVVWYAPQRSTASERVIAFGRLSCWNNSQPPTRIACLRADRRQQKLHAVSNRSFSTSGAPSSQRRVRTCPVAVD